MSAGSGPPPGVALATRELSKTYEDGTVALDRVSLDAAPGEFVVVLGPTGCGKTTLLRLVAGLDHPTGGEVLIDGQVVNEQPAQTRQVAMVFQEFSIYPHLTVAENIAFPLRVAHVPDAAARATRTAELLGLAEVLDRHPHQLSGGERQRVATGRVLVREPKAFLLDEPLSNLDATLRAELRAEVAALARKLRVTALYVTHDQSEAISLADRIVVLRHGTVQQVGRPGEVYADPATVFVAAFLALPRPNLVQAAVYLDRDHRRIEIDFGSQVIQTDWDDARMRWLGGHHAERVTVALRSEALIPATSGTTGPVVRGTVQAMEYLGHEILVYLDAGMIGTATELSQLESAEPDQTLVVRVPAARRPRLGEPLTVAIDLTRVLFFDHHGARIRD